MNGLEFIIAGRSLKDLVRFHLDQCVILENTRMAFVNYGPIGSVSTTLLFPWALCTSRKPSIS
jgi:hypothetical protein